MSSFTGSTLDAVIAAGYALTTHDLLPDGKAYVFDTDKERVFVSAELRAKLQKHPGLAGIILVDEVRMSMLNIMPPFIREPTMAEPPEPTRINLWKYYF